ncbi:MAG: hypothetical protein S4CHLAM81_02500 [Chlamydiales bacterium]|nr:hypothetical protein [Chlamydiales bacterium]MCH9635042.1 hypothetical protein [Chlamydiales bacterium]MCH9703649.1 glycosyltransferase [Chlamydiota bacterium]
MKKSITIPYNEVLPTGRAHDVFLFQEAAALSKEFDVTLLCGKGSASDKELFAHYNTEPFKIKRLPIVRKNNPLNLSWNRPFFHFCQKELRGTVILSVLKQAAYHLRRKKADCHYVYEVHQLTAYDGKVSSMEQEVFDRADQILVTTKQLKNCIKTKTAVDVVPLAVNRKKLPPIEKSEPFVLTYVGQLYKAQGVEELLKCARGVELRIVGGRPQEIERLRGLNPAAKFYGYVAPSELEEIVSDSHAFVAPFELSGRMPYVAHTKLHEYSAWGRPFIAPDAAVVRDEFSKGVYFYKPGELRSTIDRLVNDYSLCEMPSYSWSERKDQMMECLQKN